MSRERRPRPRDVGWANEIFELLLSFGVRQVAYVPDAGLTELIRRCHADGRMTAIPLTTEEEGVALLAGAWLGGERGVLLSQSSGLGNCVNMLGIVQECRFPFLAIVTMRGEPGERNPWQVPMGRGLPAVLEAMGVGVETARDAERVREVVERALHRTFDSGEAVAVLISQRVVGVKTFSLPNASASE